MIETVSELLEQFKKKELEVIKKYEIVDHPRIIGDMYEGLTEDILKKALFRDLDLRVVGGKITNKKSKLSDEIDCMLVEGDGQQIPHTDDFIYHFSQVIAVIQVKKNLYSEDIEDSYENLKSVIDVQEPMEAKSFRNDLLRDAFRSIMRQELPDRKELSSLSSYEQIIYHTLLLEAFYPVRIVWGYYGFKSESNLRRSFSEYLKRNITKDFGSPRKGFGPSSLPNLIICGQYSLIKGVGMPFYASIQEDGYWPLLFSTSGKPISHFLEIIWTKLSYRYGITAEIFGDDLTMEELNRFLDGRFIERRGIQGWEYNYWELSEETLSKPLKTKEWEPFFANEAQAAVFQKLCDNETVDTRGENLIEYIRSQGYEFDDFVKTLTNSGLVFLKGYSLHLLTDNCAVVILPDGRIAVGDNKAGRLMRWVMNHLMK